MKQTYRCREKGGGGERGGDREEGEREKERQEGERKKDTREWERKKGEREEGEREQDREARETTNMTPTERNLMPKHIRCWRNMLRPTIKVFF